MQDVGRGAPVEGLAGPVVEALLDGVEIGRVCCDRSAYLGRAGLTGRRRTAMVGRLMADAHQSSSGRTLP